MFIHKQIGKFKMMQLKLIVRKIDNAQNEVVGGTVIILHSNFPSKFLGLLLWWL